jgi:capsid protein
LDDNDDIMIVREFFDVNALVSRVTAEVTEIFSARIESLKEEMNVERQSLKEEINVERQRTSNLERVAEADRDILLIRQLAFAYQETAARLVGCGNTKPHFVTPASLAQFCLNADVNVRTTFTSIEWEFGKRGISDIENFVKKIRELGTASSHPTTTLEGAAVSKNDMKAIIKRNETNIPFDCNDVEKLLDIICVLREDDGPGVLIVKSLLGH